MQQENAPVARTAAGLVSGLRLPGLELFIEIPYGAIGAGGLKRPSPTGAAP